MEKAHRTLTKPRNVARIVAIMVFGGPIAAGLALTLAP